MISSLFTYKDLREKGAIASISHPYITEDMISKPDYFEEDELNENKSIHPISHPIDRSVSRPMPRISNVFQVATDNLTVSIDSDSYIIFDDNEPLKLPYDLNENDSYTILKNNKFLIANILGNDTIITICSYPDFDKTEFLFKNHNLYNIKADPLADDRFFFIEHHKLFLGQIITNNSPSNHFSIQKFGIRLFFDHEPISDIVDFDVTQKSIVVVSEKIKRGNKNYIFYHQNRQDVFSESTKYSVNTNFNSFPKFAVSPNDYIFILYNNFIYSNGSGLYSLSKSKIELTNIYKSNNHVILIYKGSIIIDGKQKGKIDEEISLTVSNAIIKGNHLILFDENGHILSNISIEHEPISPIKYNLYDKKFVGLAGKVIENDFIYNDIEKVILSIQEQMMDKLRNINEHYRNENATFLEDLNSIDAFFNKFSDKVEYGAENGKDYFDSENNDQDEEDDHHNYSSETSESENDEETHHRQIQSESESDEENDQDDDDDENSSESDEENDQDDDDDENSSESDSIDNHHSSDDNDDDNNNNNNNSSDDNDDDDHSSNDDNNHRSVNNNNKTYQFRPLHLTNGQIITFVPPK